MKPYPTRLSVRYHGHQGIVRSVDVDPSGQFLVSGGEDQAVRVWEISSGRCVMAWLRIGNVVARVSWSPALDKPFIAVAAGANLYILSCPKICCSSKDTFDSMAAIFANFNPNNSSSSGNSSGKDKRPPVTWTKPATAEHKEAGVVAVIAHERPVTSLSW